MQHFYATVPPAGRAKTQIGRCGYKSTGIETVVACREGVIVTRMWFCNGTKRNRYVVELREHGGKGSSVSSGKLRELLASGFCDDPATHEMQNAKCDDCSWQGPQSETESVSDLHDRVDAGGTMPAGECPSCGALAYACK